MSDDPRHASDEEAAQRRLAQAFQDDLAAAGAEAPSFEDVAAYVEGRLQGDARALFEERLASDPLLRTEVADLRELRAEMASRGAAPAWTRWAAAAAVIASLGGGWLWIREARTRGPVARSESGSPSPSAKAGAPAVARLRDDSGAIALLADGTVEGVPAGLQSRVADALRSGTLRVPALRNDLAVSPVTAMGAGGPAAAFGPTSPLSTLVSSDRPTLRWTAHPAARGYVVSVYDLELEPVATSTRLTTTEWTPEGALPRGRTYLWQVEAFTAAGRVAAPAPPAPEARFHVASAETEREVRRLLADAGSSHLAAGVVLAEHGFLDEASRELERLAALNPGSAEVERLRSAVSAARPR